MSEYDSRAIEKKAINEVDRFFENSNVVATYINDGDKEPFFDGHLYLYAGGKRNNEHYTGRVAVQVKGKDLDEFKDGKFCYPIEMLDLKAYLHEGIVYFVVQEVGKEKRLYYRLLTPIELRSIIQDNAGQITVSVRMNRAYDHDIKTIEIEIIQFEHDCKKQVSYADAPIFNFEDFGKNGIHSFSIDITMKDKNVPFLQAVTTKPIYLYADVPGGAKVPMGTGPANIALMRDVEEPVEVAGRIFYQNYKTKMEGGMLTITVGDCFTITLDPSGNKQQASMNMKRRAKMLKDVITEAEFILELQRTKKIKIGALNLSIPFPAEHEITEGLSEYLKAWHELDDMLTGIECNKDLDMTQITQKDEKTIDVLINMLGQGKACSLTNVTIGINNVQLANLNLWLMIYKNQEGKHEIKSLFDHSLGYKAEFNYPEGKLEECLYSGLERGILADCDNVPYSDVIPSYESLKTVNPHIYERGNLFLLELIAAYDKTTDEVKKKVMFNAAIEISNWLLDKDGGNQVLHVLNKYQILKRNANLNDEQKAELKKIQMENAGDDEIAYAASLLLDDKASAEYHWNRLDTETQEIYKERMPIYKFHA